MKKAIAVRVEPADISRFEADVVALKYAGGLFGASLAVAKALGQTEASMQQKLPSVGALTLLPGMGRIKARQALFLRVVKLSSFDYTEIRQFSFDVLKGLGARAPETRHLALTVHGTGFGLSAAKTIHAEIYGCIEAVRAREFPPALERVSIVDRDQGLVRQFWAVLAKLLPEGRIEVPSGPGREGAEGDSERSGSGVADAVASGAASGAPAVTISPSAEYDVFISYKSEDTAYAQEVYDLLTGRGMRVFFSRESLPRLGSDEYHERIDSAIEKARHMVVVASSGEHATAKWVSYEWRLFLGEKLAGRKEGNLVTVVAGGMSIGDLPIGLRHREVIQLTPEDRDRLFQYLRED